MPRNYDHLVAFALEHPWAITPNMRALIAGILARRMAGHHEADDAAILAAQEARAAREHPVPTGGVVRVIPVSGVIAPRMNLFSEMSGGTTFEALTAQLQQATADPNVKAIVFDVDSPGGNVAGASEFAREVLKARAVKKVIAQANHTMASAAYWFAACATEIVASPSAMVGSIGVYSMYDDLSEALSSLGIKREVFSAGKYKAEGIGGTGLTDDARVHVQSLIDGAYNRFVGDVAKGRGVSAAAVRNGYGEGRALDAEHAKDEHLIDRIATLQDTIARYAGTTREVQGTRAELTSDPPPPATDQEPSPATSQEPRAVPIEASFVGYEQRLLVLTTSGLGS